MRVRVVITGTIAGMICLLFLGFQYYSIGPVSIIPDWPSAAKATIFPEWMSDAILIFCGLTLFSFGWVAARWNWTANWRASLLDGGSAGIIAGCLIYDFIGVFWFGLKGQEEILKNFYIPLTEAEGTRILIESIFRTGTLLYLNFIWVVLACAVVGSLGGLASAIVDVKDLWGANPRKPEGWLFRLSAYMLTIFGFLNLIVTMAGLSTLWDVSLKTAAQFQEKYGLQLSHGYSRGSFFLLSYLIGLIFALLPASFTWGWILRAWRIRKKTNFLSIVWLVITIAGAIYILFGFMPASSGFSPLEIISLIFMLLVGTGVGLMTEDDSEGFPYHPSDWVGYGLTYGILGGTQIIMGVLGFSLAITLIAIINIPHLITSGVVDKSPTDQVIYLHTIQYVASATAVLGSLLIGLIVAGSLSFARTVMGVKDFPPQPQLD